MPNPQRISIDPDPPVHGETLTVCYDFAGTTLQKVDLKLSFGVAGVFTVTIDRSVPCVQVAVPGTATTLEIVDLTGDSESLVTTVE